eukprot:4424999-Prymnesium_polylepis.1
MVPSIVVALDKFPTTATGKADLAALSLGAASSEERIIEGVGALPLKAPPLDADPLGATVSTAASGSLASEYQLAFSC